MHYAVRHVTRYRYSAPIAESHMELRMQPRNEGLQLCWDFQVRTLPRTKVDTYRDSLGNVVHFFDVPARHSRLTITADARVELTTPPPLPESLDPSAWDHLAPDGDHDDDWEMLAPSKFARPTDLLAELRDELDLGRRDDPLTVLRSLNQDLYDAFAYTPRSTRVDSPIDESLASRQGVCQDFTHIMIALVRGLGIPCRYVSGYLFHDGGAYDRSTPAATHAWAEAKLPGLGWVGFDPTNNLVSTDRHIRVAVGRDYADIPPTRGVFTGHALSELAVEVKVSPSEAPIVDDAPSANVWIGLDPEEAAIALQQAQQQQ